jgi:pilus assembly protein CpaE
MPFMTGLELCQQVRERAETRFLPVIMISDQDSIEDKIEGFKAGADDFLSKPVHPRELLARINALLVRARMARGQKAYTVAVLGAKGGVGVTSIAVNVGVALAQREWAVALAELHPSRGDLRYHVNVSATPSLAPLLETDPKLLEPADVDDRLANHSSGLKLLFGPTKAGSKPLSADHVEEIITSLQRNNDFLLLDLPSAEGPHVRRALELTDYTLLVTEPHTLSILCGRNLLELLDEWRVGEPLGAVIVAKAPSGILLTRMEVENEIGLGGSQPRDITYREAQMEGRVEARQGVVATIPPAPEAFQESVAAGVPIVLLDPSARAARALVSVADLLLERVEPAEIAQL